MKGTLKFLNIRKGDTVVVLSGKSKGSKGKVMKTIPTAGKVLVEGINMVSKSLRPTQAMPQGKIAKREAPILDNKSMVICPSCYYPTNVAHRLGECDNPVRSCRDLHVKIDRVRG